MRKLSLLLLLAIQVSTFAQWTKIASPTGEQVNSIRNLDGTYYAATNSGLYKYAGNAWSLVSNLDGYWVKSIFEHNDTLFAGTPGNAYRSTDNGLTWISTNIYDITGWSFYADNIFATGWDGLFRSDNNGDTWTNLTNLDYGHFLRVITYNNSLLAGTSYGVYMSSDTGKTWQPKVSGLATYNDVRSLIQVEDALFAGIADHGVYISTDGATTWNPVNSGLNNLDIYSLYFLNDTLWAGTEDSVYFCTDYSNPVWYSANINTYASQVMDLNSFQNSIVACNQYGISVNTTDGFKSFNEGFANKYAYELFELFGELCTRTSGGYYHYNSAENKWSCFPAIPRNAQCLTLFNDSMVVFKGSEAKDVIKISIDSLKTWQTIYSTIDHIQYVTVQDSSIYLGIHDGPVRYSNDLGATWNTIPGTVPYLDHLVVVDSVVIANGDQIYRSVNHSDWEPVGWGTALVNRLKVKNDVLYVLTTNNGMYYSLYRSDDYGENFKWLAGPSSPEEDIQNLVENAIKFKILPSAFVSLDGNKINVALENDSTWLRMSRGYVSNEENAVLDLAAENDGKIYISNLTGEIWYRSIADLVPPATPSNVTYNVGSGNLMTVKWTDNSNNESSFRIRRSYEEYDLVFAGNTNEITFDLDTLYASGDMIPFFMVADNNGDWSVFSDTSVYSMPDGIEQNPDERIRVYPIPVNSILNIDMSGVSGNPEYITITNISGMEIVKLRYENDRTQINTEQLPHGVYVLTINFNNGITERLKFTK